MTQALINGELAPSNRKLFSYSTHEVNVLHLLTVFGVEVESMIPHGAHIMLAIHKINEIYGIQVEKIYFVFDVLKILLWAVYENFAAEQSDSSVRLRSF